ncbi:MAG TPA: ABC transporter permease [Candidatus Sulfotelmatobacter sp.]|nr:ABC transporter permease [Candidatus Sulfotelmatobacter sp.]
MNRVETATVVTGFSPRRVGALILRYLYVLRSSWPRLAELAYWPSMQVIVWGFITQFFRTNSTWVAQATGVLLGAVLLWDVLFRSQLGVSVSFLEEMWSRNLGHLFVSPLRPYEFLAALTTMSLVRTLIGMLPAALLAIPLYHFSIFDLGLPLLAFFANVVVTGWAIGIAVSGLILRYGLGAESFAWVAVFAISPVAAVFYPVSVLPGWLQPVAYALPPAHVFEGMRALMFEHVFRFDLFFTALGLNAAYLAAAGVVFLVSFGRARQLGKLMQVGE